MVVEIRLLDPDKIRECRSEQILGKRFLFEWAVKSWIFTYHQHLSTIGLQYVEWCYFTLWITVAQRGFFRRVT